MAVAAGIRGQRSATSAGAWGWTSLAAALAVLAAGSNEVVLILLGLVLLVLAWQSRRLRLPWWYLWLLPLALDAVSFAIDVFAPGNARRAEVTGGLQLPFGPLLGSAAFSASALLEWVSSAPVLLGLLALVMLGAVASERLEPESIWRRAPWWVPAVVAAAGVWGAFFFTHWASGFTFRPGPPGRVQNVVCLFALVTLAITAFTVGVQRMHRYAGLGAQLAPAGGWVVPLMLVLLFGEGNVRRAYFDLVVGRAASYDRELTARYVALEEASTRRSPVVAPALTRIPATIFFRDIATDPSDWRNRCYATFWRVPEVKLQPPSGE
jgi:hypothetical protein